MWWQHRHRAEGDGDPGHGAEAPGPQHSHTKARNILVRRLRLHPRRRLFHAKKLHPPKAAVSTRNRVCGERGLRPCQYAPSWRATQAPSPKRNGFDQKPRLWGARCQTAPLRGLVGCNPRHSATLQATNAPSPKSSGFDQKPRLWGASLKAMPERKPDSGPGIRCRGTSEHPSPYLLPYRYQRISSDVTSRDEI